MGKSKKTLLILLAAAMLLLLAGCESGEANTSAQKTTDTVPVIINQAEYVLYQNVFYNGYADSNTGAVTKRGVYATLQDAYNNVTRHYVWGYLDNTLCCDWQWEFVPEDGTQLPAPGSEIEVRGNFVKDEDALDGYRIRDARVATQSIYTGETAELSMLTMSDTLERVQMINIKNRKEQFEGKKFTAFGRIAATDKLEDPYYGDQAWNISIQASSPVPATGTMVRLRGTIRDGQLGECALDAVKE